jgi:hypothetical protein
VLLASASAANAKTIEYNWSYSFVDGMGAGSGHFFASSSLPATIVNASGTISSDPDLGSALAVTGLSNFASADNTIYALGFDNGDVSYSGISLATSAGNLNLFTNASLSTGFGYVLNSVTSPSGAASTNYSYEVAYSITVATVAAPEPSTWTMMGLGFAGLGFAGYRARRTAISIA